MLNTAPNIWNQLVVCLFFVYLFVCIFFISYAFSLCLFELKAEKLNSITTAWVPDWRLEYIQYIQYIQADTDSMNQKHKVIVSKQVWQILMTKIKETILWLTMTIWGYTEDSNKEYIQSALMYVYIYIYIDIDTELWLWHLCLFLQCSDLTSPIFNAYRRREREEERERYRKKSSDHVQPDKVHFTI